MKHQPAVPPWSGFVKPSPSQWSVYGNATRRPSAAASYSATSQPGSHHAVAVEHHDHRRGRQAHAGVPTRRHALVLGVAVDLGRERGSSYGEPLSTTTTSVGMRATSQMRSIVRFAIAASSGVRLHTGMRDAEQRRDVRSGRRRRCRACVHEVGIGVRERLHGGRQGGRDGGAPFGCAGGALGVQQAERLAVRGVQFGRARTDRSALRLRARRPAAAARAR